LEFTADAADIEPYNIRCLIFVGNSMNATARWSNTGISSASIVLAAAMAVIVPPVAAGDSAKPAVCSDPLYRQFDFWMGDWDVIDVDNPGKPVARTRVTRILGGCVLLEDYQATDGHAGQSFTIYDASRHIWHQTWVTDRGALLTIEGGIQDGAMVLSGADLTRDHKERRVRGTWRAAGGGVRETAVISTDGGQTWTPWFDLLFRQHAP
jgi:hypothetical protein